MRKVALFTTFYEAESGYSLITVASGQMNMLLAHGYNPAVLVQENFTPPADNPLWQPEMVDLRPVVPAFDLDNGVAADFEDRVSHIVTALADALDDVTVCITHDIILQMWYKEHNVAMRRYAKTRPDLLWLHWLHSCPTPSGEQIYPANCRYTPPPGYIVYPNATDLSLVRQTYRLGGQEFRAKVCRHSVDPLETMGYDKMTKDLATRSGLLSAEIGVVYPARLDRGKQPEKIIRLLAGVQKAGYEANFLIVDWQSGGAHFQKYIDELLALAKELGLEGKVNFTSRLDDRCSQGVPHRVVMELMDLASVYIHPSRVETYSLVTHEAILRGNLAVLNHDFPPARELFGEAAIYMDFGSDRAERTYRPDEQTFWNDEARRLLAEYRSNRVLVARTTARREWSPGKVWVDFEPLLYLPPVGE